MIYLTPSFALNHLLAFRFFFFFRLKLECEKLASEKTEMQRHYVMVRHFVSSFLYLSSLLDRGYIFSFVSQEGFKPKALGQQ